MEPVGDGTKAWWSNPVCLEAADEIEDLRAELKEFSSQYQQLKRELEIYKDLYAREAVERVEQTTPIVAPKGSVLVLKLQDNQHPYLQSELAEITNQMKLKLGVDVIMIQGWDVAGFWEKENTNG
jgi:dsDNA-specific endonuclease/ATPase MutS2